MILDLFKNKKPRRTEKSLSKELAINNKIIENNLELLKSLTDDLTKSDDEQEIRFISESIDKLRSETTELVLRNSNLKKVLKEF